MRRHKAHELKVSREAAFLAFECWGEPHDFHEDTIKAATELRQIAEELEALPEVDWTENADLERCELTGLYSNLVTVSFWNTLDDDGSVVPEELTLPGQARDVA